MANGSEVLVLQHAACEGLGTIEPALSARGLSPRRLLIHEGQPVPRALDGAAGLIVMGGPMSVYDTLPHLKEEMRLIEAALRAGLPVLGVCLGSQLLAHVLGARVYPGRKKEIGWHRVSLSPAAASDPLWSDVPREFVGFHWHGDIFDLPDGATALASSDLTAVQAFRATGVSGPAYGILFHLEVTAEQIADMCRLFPDEMRQGEMTTEQIASGTAQHLAELTEHGRRVFDAWASEC